MLEACQNGLGPQELLPREYPTVVRVAVVHTGTQACVEYGDVEYGDTVATVE